MLNMHMHKHMLNKVESVQIWVDFFKIWFQHGFYEWFYFNTYYWTQHQKWQKFLKFLGHDKKFLWSSKSLWSRAWRFYGEITLSKCRFWWKNPPVVSIFVVNRGYRTTISGIWTDILEGKKDETFQCWPWTTLC